jgi:hypothetical protein
MDSYEKWTRGEITRLRSVAQKATADADVMQSAFDKWLESQGRNSESPEAAKPEDKQSLNGHTQPHRRAKRPVYGDKNSTALEKIRAASPNGLTTDELFNVFSEIYGQKYKRSSLRALLWHQKDLGTIVNNGGRYVIAPPKAGA